MKYILCILFIINSAYAQHLRKDKWDKVLEMISHEEKTILQAKGLNSALKYRLFELKSERIKIWQQKENEIFMKKSTEGIKISRSQAFKTTRKLYLQTRDYGLEIIKNHPKSKYVSAIYYSLALNSRDYSDDLREYAYLQKAIGLSSKKSDLNYYARTSLAEYYYNNKMYKEAVVLYKDIVKNENDEWFTKNLYNYGWCLVKTHKFELAIDVLEKAYQLSTTGNYINFQEQIITGLTSFYVMGKEIKRGRDFILANEGNKYEALFQFTKKVSNKGYYEESLELIRLLPNYFNKTQRDEQLADITLFEFDFFKQFNQKDSLVKTAIKLNNIKLNQDQKQEAITKLASEVGEYQQLLKKSFDKHDFTYNKELLSNINLYFDILSKVDFPNKAKYLFYKAESNYAVQEYAIALKIYKQALENYIEAPSDINIKRKSMDSIFSSIEFAKLPKDKEIVELEYAYRKHLDLWPKDEKSKIIFSKLFSLYLNKKDVFQTQKTLDWYISSFPKEKKEQQRLFKIQLDFIIKSGDADLLAKKIGLLENKYLNFNQKMIDKSTSILATMLFKKFQKLNKEDKKDEALAGYKKIFYSDKYPQSIKAEAAFNMGIIYVDLFETKNAIKWFEKGLPLFQRKEKESKRKYLDKVALRASLLQDLLNAAQLKKLVLNEFCLQTPKENYTTLNQAIQFDLANNYINKALHTFKTYKKCTNQDLSQIQETILDHLYLNNQQSELLTFIDAEKLHLKFKEKIGTYYEQFYWRYYDNNISQESLYSYRLKELKCKSCNILLSSKQQYQKFQEEVKNYMSNHFSIKKPFDPESFNQKLNQRISSLKPILEQGEHVLKNGHPEFSILTFEKMVELVEFSNVEIKNLSVPVEDQEFQKQFKSQMLILANNILGQKTSIQARVNKLIQKNELFTNQQRRTHFAYEVLEISDIRNPAGKMVSTLDIKE